eukprot:gb/GFBE01046215.1/.p1 GENE.gb/GFBE01046215.1/~~gb/GFBE01046215.1/.p1  ORF type:complete len:203 (+),score=38.22 gb/GFBE01046215.1/:1-609(+)
MPKKGDDLVNAIDSTIRNAAARYCKKLHEEGVFGDAGNPLEAMMGKSGGEALRGALQATGFLNGCDGETLNQFRQRTTLTDHGLPEMNADQYGRSAETLYQQFDKLASEFRRLQKGELNEPFFGVEVRRTVQLLEEHVQESNIVDSQVVSALTKDGRPAYKDKLRAKDEAMEKIRGPWLAAARHVVETLINVSRENFPVNTV